MITYLLCLIAVTAVTSPAWIAVLAVMAYQRRTRAARLSHGVRVLITNETARPLRLVADETPAASRG